MKKKKRLKAFLAVLLTIVMVAICFGCVWLYLRHEQAKPVFHLPELTPQASVTSLPENAKDAAVYIDRLYQAAITADDVEGDWHTDVHLGDMKTPFAEADNVLVQYIREQAPGQIAAFYPSASELVMAKTTDAPAFQVDPAKVIDYNGHQGESNENGDDSIHYYLNFTLTPDDVDVKAVQNGTVYQKITKTLSPAGTIEAFAMTPESETVSCRIDRLSDNLQNVTITKGYAVKATVRLSDDYAALLDSRVAEVELPYETVETINFHRYGARFTERQIAVKKGDMRALPADVVVHSTATQDDFTLTFTPSVDGVMTIDADGVMNVKDVCDDPVIITMTLEYDGHTYTDDLTVYITEMELETEAAING